MGQFEYIILHYQATNIINTTVSFGVQRKDLKKIATHSTNAKKNFWPGCLNGIFYIRTEAL